MPSIFFQPDAQAIVANFTQSAKSDAVNLVEKYLASHTHKHARRGHFARRTAFDASSHRVHSFLQRVYGQFDIHIRRKPFDDATRSAPSMGHLCFLLWFLPFVKMAKGGGLRHLTIPFFAFGMRLFLSKLFRNRDVRNGHILSFCDFNFAGFRKGV